MEELTFDQMDYNIQMATLKQMEKPVSPSSFDPLKEFQKIAKKYVPAYDNLTLF